MLRQVVSSSSVRSIGYDRAHALLEVEFSSGKIYQYEGVTAEIARAFVSAESKGAFFNEHVRDRYPAVRIN